MLKTFLCPMPMDEDTTTPEDEVSPQIELAQETVKTSSLLDTGIVELPPVKRKSPLCSYCKQSGHRNQLVKGKIVCPKRRDDSENSAS